ncbi:MAG: single-stranded DNA-binding protein [Thermodesulfobacteriota bacterium]|nr:single-stranded DNA-binding protein [Thermodesulfobacteriota bacterium]
MSVNKVILVGRLGADPEMKYTSEGTAVATFRIATTKKWTNQNGEKEERTEWHRIVAWRRLGEICGEYLSKGRQVYIEGELQSRSWEDKDGIRRWVTEVVAFNMQMLGGPSDKPRMKNDYGEGIDKGMLFDSEDDIPF